MADEEKQENPEEQAESQKEETPSKGMGLFTWAVLGMMVFAGLVGGFALAQLLGGSETETVQNNNENPEISIKPVDEWIEPDAEGKKPWYFPMEAVVANLDEPGVTRFLRAAITLEISPEMNQEKGLLFLEEKKLILRDWLTTYINGLSLEDVRGSQNVNRIKKQIRENFNELLFAESKPCIQGIFLTDFAVQ